MGLLARIGVFSFVTTGLNEAVTGSKNSKAVAGVGVVVVVVVVVVVLSYSFPKSFIFSSMSKVNLFPIGNFAAI